MALPIQQQDTQAYLFNSLESPTIHSIQVGLPDYSISQALNLAHWAHSRKKS